MHRARTALTVALILLFTGAIRARLLDLPLERDEGEYAYAGQLLLEGVPPYKIAANMKLPGVYAAYAGIEALFGQSARAIHVGLLLVNAATIVLIFFLGRRLFGTSAGLASCAAYALLSLGPTVLGTAAHATHFVVLPAVAGMLLLWQATETDAAIPLFAGGLLFGIAFLMKQHGACFAIAGVAYLLWRRKSWRQTLLFVFAAALPLALTCLLLWRAGVFQKFWFWTFSYAAAYVSEMSFDDAFSNLALTAVPLLMASLPLWIFTAAGLVFAYRDRNLRPAAIFLLLFFMLSCAAVCPGWFFRQHYYVLILPAAALLAGGAIATAPRRFGKLPAAAFALSLAFCVVRENALYFRMNILEATRRLYEVNLFPEAAEVAKYVRAHTAPDAQIAVIGSEPEIYFLAHRRSATSYLYTYGLLELQPYAVAMQQEFFREIQTARPEYIVVVVDSDTWNGVYTFNPIRDWWANYRAGRYSVIGVIHMLAFDRTEYRWNEHGIDDSPAAAPSMLVYRRMVR